MIKKIIIILLLLAANAGIGYFGYVTYTGAGAADPLSAEILISEMDQGILDINSGTPTDEEIAEIEGVPQNAEPVTVETIDSLLLEIEGLSSVDTKFGATLNDL